MNSSDSESEDVAADGDEGYTRNMQLCVAVYEGDLYAAKALIEGGADINYIVENSACVDLRKTVMAAESLDDQLKILEDHYTCSLPKRYKSPPLVRSLRDWGKHFHFSFGHPTPLKIAVVQENIRMTRLLLKLGGRAQIKHSGEDYVMFIAVRSENVELVRTLLRGGADPNVYDCNNRTLIYHSINMQAVEILRELIRYGADIEMRSRKSFGPAHVFGPLYPRPLMLAASLYENDHELALELVLSGADLEAVLEGWRDYVDGMSTPLEDPTDMLAWAIDKIRSCGVLIGFVKLLIKAGAPVRMYHRDRARYWASKVIRHAAEQDPGPDTDPNYEVRALIDHAFGNPDSLMHKCRLRIRGLLQRGHPCADIRRSVDKLTCLPDIVRSFLALQDLNEDRPATPTPPPGISDAELAYILGIH